MGPLEGPQRVECERPDVIAQDLLPLLIGPSQNTPRASCLRMFIGHLGLELHLGAAPSISWRLENLI